MVRITPRRTGATRVSGTAASNTTAANTTAANTTAANATTTTTTTTTMTATSTKTPSESVVGGTRSAPPEGVGATTSPRGTVALAPGVAFAAGRLVIDGEPAASRAFVSRSGGAALISAARRVVDEASLGRLTAPQRRALIDELVPVLRRDRADRGRPSLREVRARSGAFTLLEECARVMRVRDESRDARALAAALVDAARIEKDPGLRAHMERRIGQLPAHVIGDDIAATVEEMRARQARERPLTDAWLKGQPPTLRVLASVMEEFWKEELAEYRRQGYEVKQPRTGLATATKRVDDVDPAVIVTVDLRCREAGVFDGMDDKDFDVVLYTGHAQLGGIAKESLADGPQAAMGNKLVALFACRTKQSLPALERRHPGQHILVSDQGTYGHDDRIVQHALIDGIVRGKSYAQIERSCRRQDLWEPNNYVFPHEAAALVAGDRVYVPESRRAPGTSMSMRPSAHPPSASALPHGPVVDAVAWLNTIHTYWAEGSGTKADKALSDTIVSGGFFDGGTDGPVVDVRREGGRITVSVNAAYAHQDPDALGMMVSFAAGKELAALGDTTRSEHDTRMLGLAMAGSYAYYLVRYTDTADLLVRQLGRRFGFPPGLSWPVVEKAIRADMDKDCSPKSIAMLERGMQHVFLEVNPDRTSAPFRRYVGAALDELKKSKAPIGRMTHDLISSGRVRIDDLADLTRTDYLHVRREMLKSGVKLPADHKVIEDTRSSAWRAITNDMNGYMWDDRIYVARGLSPRDLAATLVHEVNHVLNKSEERYDSDAAIFVEEYRAFYCEALFRGEKLTPAKCRAIKEGVIVDYGLQGVTPDDLPDTPPGIILA